MSLFLSTNSLYQIPRIRGKECLVILNVSHCSTTYPAPTFFSGRKLFMYTKGNFFPYQKLGQKQTILKWLCCHHGNEYLRPWVSGSGHGWFPHSCPLSEMPTIQSRNHHDNTDWINDLDTLATVSATALFFFLSSSSTQSLVRTCLG